MAGVYQQDTSHDATLRATLDVTDKDGHTVRKRFTISRVGSFGNGKTLVRFTDPPELRGVTLLSINQPGVTDRQWIYTPATERVRSVPPRERSERFAGSDFTYEDIAERSLDDFTYQLLPAEDNIENHKTFKVEATPVAPDRSQYKYHLLLGGAGCTLHPACGDVRSGVDARCARCTPADCAKNPGSGARGRRKCVRCSRARNRF